MRTIYCRSTRGNREGVDESTTIIVKWHAIDYIEIIMQCDGAIIGIKCDSSRMRPKTNFAKVRSMVLLYSSRCCAAIAKCTLQLIASRCRLARPRLGRIVTRRRAKQGVATSRSAKKGEIFRQRATLRRV